MVDSTHVDPIELLQVICEGCLDRLAGRPLWANPYDPKTAMEQFSAWWLAWKRADRLLDERLQQEARRWLEAA